MANSEENSSRFVLSKHEPDAEAIQSVLVDGISTPFWFEKDFLKLELQADPHQVRNIEIIDREQPNLQPRSFGVDLQYGRAAAPRALRIQGQHPRATRWTTQGRNRDSQGIESYGRRVKKSIVRRVWNRVLGMLARFVPGATSLRPFLHKLRGARITGRVFIGDDVYLENEYPECIEVHDGAQICLRSILIAHTRGPGRIVIGKNAFVGANCVLTTSPGVTLTIGEGAVITASSVVSSDVPAHMLVGNVKAKPIARATVALTLETPYDRFLAGLRPLKGKSESR